VNAQPVARALAAGRVAVGAALCVAPALASHWVGADGRRAGARTLTRALGARDAALGLGTLAAAGDPAELRHWLLASSLSDAVDLAATFTRPASWRRSVVLALAGSGAAASLLLSAAVTEEVDR
jgi:MFS family permease